MNISTYMPRIHCGDHIEYQKLMDLVFLTQLQAQHLLHIYFENVDIMQNTPLDLEEEKVYEKLILSKRGGIC